MLIDGDVGVFQPQLALAPNGIRPAQVHMPLANRLDLRPHQRDPRLNCAIHKVIVVRLPVDGDHLDPFRFLCRFALRFLHIFRLFCHKKTPSCKDVYLPLSPHSFRAAGTLPSVMAGEIEWLQAPFSSILDVQTLLICSTMAITRVNGSETIIHHCAVMVDRKAPLWTCHAERAAKHPCNHTDSLPVLDAERAAKHGTSIA